MRDAVTRARCPVGAVLWKMLTPRLRNSAFARAERLAMPQTLYRFQAFSLPYQNAYSYGNCAQRICSFSFAEVVPLIGAGCIQ